MNKTNPGIGFVIITLPIPGFVSVVSLAVFWLSGDGVQLAPGLPSGLVDLSFFLFGKLLIGNVFFHNINLLVVIKILYHASFGDS